jgi:hypothetical protein
VATFVAIVLVAITAASLLVTLAAFIWAAFKDGEDNDAVQARLLHRRFPPN